MSEGMVDRRERKLNYHMHRAKDYLEEKRLPDSEARILALHYILKGLEPIEEVTP